MSSTRVALRLAIAALLGGTAAAMTTGPATGPTASPATAGVAGESVATLVRQLDADNPAARDAAGDQLVAVGEPARAVVADAAAHADSPEVRARAANLIVRLDRALARRPTVVTLHADGANPRELFAAVTKQGGADLTFWPDFLWTGRFGPRPPRVSVDLVDRPFWDAIDELCRQSGADLVVDPPRPDRTAGVPPPDPTGDWPESVFGLTVTPGQGKGLLNGPRCDAGRATVVVRSYEQFRAVNYADGGRAGTDRVQLLALFDPKLRLVDGPTPEVTLTEAVDDRGKSIVLPSSNVQQGMAAAAASEARSRPIGFPRIVRPDWPLCKLTLDVGPPTPGATRLRTLKGKIVADVVELADRVVVDDVGHATGHAAVTRQIGGYSVRVNRCVVGGRIVTCELAVTLTDTAKADLGLARVQLLDAAGDSIASRGSWTLVRSPHERPFGGDGGTTVLVETLAAEAVRGPVQLVLTAATKAEVETFPFEFHDLDLPQP